MKATVFSIVLAMLLVCSSLGYAQQEEEEEDAYEREFVWGINKNTNGGYIGGFNVKLSRRIGDEVFSTYGLEIANVKHPKEARIPALSGGSFILGKQSYLYALRLSYGRERVLFKKGPQQGVQIAVLVSGGPTLGIIAPYYVEVSGGGPGGFTKTEPYDPTKHNKDNVFGTGRPLEGIGESSFTAGLHVRGGFSFEFGTFRSSVSGLEVGLMMEAYPEEIVLVAGSYAQQFFPSAYITLFHGSRR